MDGAIVTGPKRPAVSVRIAAYMKLSDHAKRIGKSRPTTLEQVITEYLDAVQGVANNTTTTGEN